MAVCLGVQSWAEMGVDGLRNTGVALIADLGVSRDMAVYLGVQPWAKMGVDGLQNRGWR